MNRRSFLAGSVVAAIGMTNARRASAETLYPIPSIGTCALTFDAYRATSLALMHQLSWNVTYMNDGEDFDADLATALSSAGCGRQVVTVEFWYGQNTLRDVAAGAADGNVRRIVTQMRTWQRDHQWVELILRPLHEANSAWYPWGFANGYNGNVVADFRPAWMKIHHVARAAWYGINFGWSPYGVPTSGPDTLYQSYPGNDWCEYVMFDYYNRSQSDGGWRRPAQLYARTLDELRRLVPYDKPIVIAETGTSEPHAGVNHTKAEWAGDWGAWLRSEARRYNVASVCYFNRDRSTDPSNGNDWRVDTTIASRDAFRAAISGIS